MIDEVVKFLKINLKHKKVIRLQKNPIIKNVFHLFIFETDPIDCMV